MNHLLPQRPETFEDALDAYLYFCGFEDLVPEYGERVWERFPDGYTVNPSDKEALFRLLIAFAVKERQR